MDIRQAKDQIKNAMLAYFSKDEFGNYRLPTERQRPVFAYVDDAVERGDLVNLGGLIYFTDGQGTYPARKPDYDTAFVFVDDASAAASPNVPAWAMKVELDETVVLEEMSAMEKQGFRGESHSHEAPRSLS